MPPIETPAPARPGSPALVLLTAAGSVFLLAMIQSLVVPALPQIALQLHASAATVGWVSTATLLTASALTPLLGRLGDVYSHKPVIAAVLAVTMAGSALAVASHTIGALIAARALQGAAFGLFPLGISVLRQEMPHERLTGAMAVTASALGVGSGVALVATGLLTRGGADYRRIFWLTLIMSALLLVLALVALPRRARQGGTVDYGGAAVLAAGLVALLLPLSQGHVWGWGSARVIGLFAAAAVILAGFGVQQARTVQPLVGTRLLGYRPVLATNLASLCVGFAMFSVFLGATYLVETPRVLAGFGFGASVLRASVEFFLPGAVVSMFIGPVAGRLVGRIGPRLVLTLASVVGVVGMVLLAVAHASPAGMIAALIIANAAIAIAYASMPALLVTHVRPQETGIANSINSIMRSVGAAIGSALVITLLASDVVTHATPAGPVSLPAESAYRITFLLGAAFFAAAALLAVVGVGTARRPLTSTEIGEEEALSAAGEFSTASIDL